MKSVTIQIGNTDDKLTQKGWSKFVQETQCLVDDFSSDIFFCGFPPADKPWRNACWCFGINAPDVEAFKKALTRLRLKYNQDSAAVLVGDTEFV